MKTIFIIILKIFYFPKEIFLKKIQLVVRRLFNILKKGNIIVKK